MSVRPPNGADKARPAERAGALAIDTWGFHELFEDGPHADEVTRLVDGADFAFTTRDVVVETFNILVRRTGGTRIAKAWWDDLLESELRVFEPPLAELHKFVTQQGAKGAMSLTDLSLGFVALREKASGVVTGDREFRRLGLEPLFATK